MKHSCERAKEANGIVADFLACLNLDERWKCDRVIANDGARAGGVEGGSQGTAKERT